MKKTFLFLLLSTLLFSSSTISAVTIEEETIETEAGKESDKTAENSRNQLIKEYRNNNSTRYSTLEIISEHSEEIEPQDTREKALSEPIPNSGYILPSVNNYKKIAGEPRGLLSSTYNQLLASIQAYETLPEATNISEKLSRLEVLQGVTKKYYDKKLESLFKEGINARYSSESMERAKNRLEACSLLLNGIEVERLNLENGESNNTLRKGVRLDRINKPFYYQKNFTSGNLSSLAYIEVGGKEHLFKQYTNKLLPELVAKTLGFSEEIINNGGVSETLANLSGRELAAYQIAKELFKFTGIKLVPDVFPAALGDKPHQIIGNALEFIDGEQLWKEHFIKVPPEEIESLFSRENFNDFSEKKNIIAEYMADVACAKTPLPSEWMLCFPDDLEQISSEQPLYKAGKPISFERALELAQQGAFSFQKREILSVNQAINFSNPLTQKTINQIELFLLLIGETDGNETNIRFYEDAEGNWRAISIDHDLSGSCEFSDVSDEFIEKLKSEKEAMHILKMPRLVDYKMGEAILQLTPERVRQIITSIQSSKAIEAYLHRLSSMQKYIKKAKEEGRYVFDKEEGELGKIEESKEEPLCWGEKTYEMQKEDPERSLLAKLLKTREYIAQKIESTLHVKIERQREKIAAETEKLHHLLSVLQRVRNDHKDDNAPFPRSPKRSEKRSDSISSTETGQTGQTFLTSLLPYVKKATTDSLYNSYLLLQNELEKRNFKLPSSSFFEQLFHNRLLLTNEKEQKAIFKTNQLLAEAEQHQKIAEPIFENLIKELPLASELSNHQPLWEECLEQFRKAENSLSFARTAFEEEAKILPPRLLQHRKPYQEKVQQDQQRTLSNILWGQIYRAEQAASSAFKKKEGGTEQSLSHLLEAQQAWRLLFSNISPSFLEIGDPHFKTSASLENYLTPFFGLWLRAAQARYQGVTSSSIIEADIKNEEEQGHWEKLHQLVQNITPTPKSETEVKLWNHINQEIDFHKIYTSAQQKSIEVENLKEEISKLAMGNIIATEAHTLREGQGLFSPRVTIQDVAGVNLEKLGDLCHFWNQYKQTLPSTKKTWQAVVEYTEKKLTTFRNGTNEKPLEEQNSQALEACFLAKAETALTLARVAEGEFSKIENNSIPPAFSHRLAQAIKIRDLELTHHQLSLARSAINRSLTLSEHCEKNMWKPSFPTEKLKRLEEVIENKEEANNSFMIVNLFEEATMKSFLNQIDHFPEGLQFQAPLNEMINGHPDLIKETMDALMEKLNKAKDSVNEKLDQWED